MASITFTIPDNVKMEMKKLSWVNWSELARKKITKDLEKSKNLKRALKIISKSKFTKRDAEFLSKKVKKSMHNDLVKKG